MRQPHETSAAHEPSSRRQTFAHWDAPLIRWLERSGYDVDYCTDLDLHQDADLLFPYSLLLSVGHDEYWSEAMRAHLDAFTRGGEVRALTDPEPVARRLYLAR